MDATSVVLIVSCLLIFICILSVIQSGLSVYRWIRRLFGTSLKTQLKEMCPNMTNIDSLSDKEVQKMLVSEKCPIPSISGKCLKAKEYETSKYQFNEDGKITLPNATTQGVITYSQDGNLIKTDFKIGTWDGTTFTFVADPSNITVLTPCAETSPGTGLAGKCFLNGRLKFLNGSWANYYTNEDIQYTLVGNDVFLHYISEYDGKQLKFVGGITLVPCD